MKQLNYDVIKESCYNGYILENAPERVMQFGEGNFLRAFVDYFIDMMNEQADFNGKVVVVQPIARGLCDTLNQQQGLYTSYLRGFQDGAKVNNKRVISSISRCINPYDDFTSFLDLAKNPDLRFIVSNTTEAGIAYDEKDEFANAPQNSFPAKLTRFLYERYKLNMKGFIILSCELIDDNGKELLKCVKQNIANWGLEQEFLDWVENENEFCSTLVDRIVTGYPYSEYNQLNEENGYEDKLLVTAEVFGFWVIEGSQEILKELPIKKTDLPIIVTDDHSPYKKRKVRILNGVHTSMVLGCYLAGENIVRECMDKSLVLDFIDKLVSTEIIPILTLDKKELNDFAHSVVERFKNPFIDHKLLDIALNSTSKWEARVLPTMKEYIAMFDKLPPCIVYSFAAYIEFFKRGKEYTENGLVGVRGDNEYIIKDDKWITDFYLEHKDDSNEEIVLAVCKNEKMWGEDLSLIPNFCSEVVRQLTSIQEIGSKKTMQNLVQGE